MNYVLPVVKGTQAKQEYYVCMVELGLLEKLFKDDVESLPPEDRAQRRINLRRIPGIKSYILEHRESYVFSALTASVDGDAQFIPWVKNPNVGELVVPLNSIFLINDGQHRKAAILEAIENDESLKTENISLVLYKDKGLKASQQMFTDLNSHAAKTSKSIGTLYDYENDIAVLTKEVVDEIDFLRKYTDKERDNLGIYSPMLFTLHSFFISNKIIIRQSRNISEEKRFLLNFWKQVVSNIQEWKDVDERKLDKKDLRELYIITQGVTLQAIGHLGHYLYMNNDISLTCLNGLNDIDWRRNNRDWIERAIKSNGRINRSQQGIFLTYLQMKRGLGIRIDPEEADKELLAFKGTLDYKEIKIE